MFKFPNWIRDLVDAGVEITICKDVNGNVYLDLNSGAKSHMWLYDEYVDGVEKWTLRGRYEYEREVETLDDVISIFVDFYRMRDFGSSAWLDLAAKHDFLKKEVKTVVTYR